MSTTPDAPELPETHRSADERTTLVEMLDYYRAVLLRKAWGLTDAELDISLPPSDLTIGGILLHMALVEDGWFDHQFLGNSQLPIWEAIPWDQDHDWEFHHANESTAAELIEQYKSSVARSRATVSRTDDLGQLSVRSRKADGKPWNLRWIMVHMLEEYARHCGHADFIRQSIDGAVED